MTHVPPSRYSSASATRAPCPAAIRAARTPPEPPPITNRSKSYLVMSCPGYLDWCAARPKLARECSDPGHKARAGQTERNIPKESKPLLALVLRLEHLQTVMSGDDRGVGEAEEQSVLDNPRDELQGRVQGSRILDSAEGAVEDIVAAVRYERLPVVTHPELDVAGAAGVGSKHLDHVPRCRHA